MPAARTASIPLAAVSAFAASAACAVAASLLTPTERPARFGTDSTLPVPVTVTLRPHGAAPRAESGLHSPPRRRGDTREVRPPTPHERARCRHGGRHDSDPDELHRFLPVRVPGRFA